MIIEATFETNRMVINTAPDFLSHGYHLIEWHIESGLFDDMAEKYWFRPELDQVVMMIGDAYLNGGNGLVIPRKGKPPIDFKIVPVADDE